jgi:hypothetical protein
MSLRREFDLPPEDIQFLEDYGCPWEAIVDGPHWLLLHEFDTRNAGYNHKTVIAAIRIETGYPKSKLNMVYFYPHLARTDGTPIKATEATQKIGDQLYQRWSRHYTSANPWVIGENSLGTHILTVEDWLLREFEK